MEQTGPLAIWSAGGAELRRPSGSGEHPLACLVNVRLFRVEDDEGALRARHARAARARAAGLPAALPRARSRRLAGHLRNLAAYAFEHGRARSRAATRAPARTAKAAGSCTSRRRSSPRSGPCSTSIRARRTPPGSASRHTRRVPPLRVPLELDLTVADVVRAVRDDPRPFALIGDWAGSRAIVGSEPARGRGRPRCSTVEDGAGGDGDGVGGGWFGYLGTGSARRSRAAAPAAAAGAAAGREPRLLRPRAAPGRGRRLVVRGARRAARRGWRSCRRGWAPRAAAVGSTASSPAPGALGRHLAAVAGVRRADRGRRAVPGEPHAAARRAAARQRGRRLPGRRRRAPPRHGAFLDLGAGRAVLSFSPELFLRRAGDEVVTSPIKGTAPREAGAEALLASAKDAAEHVMIVDLSRNDLGRVAR